MPFFDFKRMLKSFTYASKGVVFALKEEQNFRFHLMAFLVVMAAAYFLKVTTYEFLILIIISSMVIGAELINSIFERIVDILKPRLHPIVREIKDMMAAVVLIASIGAFIVGVVILLPKMIELF